MATIRKRSWKTTKSQTRTAWTLDYVDVNGQRERRQFGTRREAEACRIEIEIQLRGGTYRPDAARVTVAEVCDLYLEHVQGRMERGERFTRHHLATVRGHLRNHIVHSERGVGAVKLAQLTTRTVGDLRDRLRTAGVSVVTTRKVLATLHGVLEYAIGQDLVAVNAAKGVKVVGRRDEGARKIVPPAADDLRRLIDAADDDFRLRLIFASATGVRAGEFHALRWRHLDLNTGELVVETRVDSYGDEDVTKTAAGMRTVPLSESLVALLKEWRLRSRFSQPGDLLFPSRRGGYESHDNMVKRRFKPLFEVAQVRPFNWHALRHFAISSWIAAGLSPKTVQTFAGHSSLQVTMDRYGHLFRSDDHKRAMEEIAQGLFFKNQ